MTQQTSPFAEVKWGWNLGESGWNTGMDENLLKFSFFFDGNIDSVVNTLPAPVNGKAYFLTTDKRLYYIVNNTAYSSPTPKWYILKIRDTGAWMQFDGNVLSSINNPNQLQGNIDSVNSAVNLKAPIANPTFTGIVSGISKAMVGLGNVDNTSDLNKPISTATQTALNNLQNTLNDSKYQSVTANANTLVLDATAARTYGVTLATNISTLTLTGATAGSRAVIDVIFTQPGTGSTFTVTSPSNVKLPTDITTIVSSARLGDITLARFICVDGTNWLYQRLAVYQTVAVSVLPSVTGENSTFNDEGDATTGWTNTNITLTQASSNLTFTKTATGAANSAKAVTLPGAGTSRDYIIYGKAKASTGTSHCQVIWLFDGGSKECGIWFGSTDGGNTSTQGGMSITGYTTSRQVASLGTGIDYTNTYIEYALQFDSTFNCVTCFFKNSTDGLWYFKGRVTHTYFAPANITVQFTSGSPANATVTLDYLTVARPNIMAIGDSICAGSTGFNPNPANNLSNDLSTWMHYAKIYTNLRNNLIVNKGIGGQTSAQTLSRISDVTNQSPQLVFLHASTNDPFQSVSKTQRTTNIQNTVNAIVNVSAKVILLNGMYGVQGSSDNTNYSLRDYEYDWWVNYRNNLTGVTGFIDIMQPIIDANGYTNSSYTQADQLHPNPTGYQRIGQYIMNS